MCIYPPSRTPGSRKVTESWVASLVALTRPAQGASPRLPPPTTQNLRAPGPGRTLWGDHWGAEGEPSKKQEVHHGRFAMKIPGIVVQGLACSEEHDWDTWIQLVKQSSPSTMTGACFETLGLRNLNLRDPKPEGSPAPWSLRACDRALDHVICFFLCFSTDGLRLFNYMHESVGAGSHSRGHSTMSSASSFSFALMVSNTFACGKAELYFVWVSCLLTRSSRISSESHLNFHRKFTRISTEYWIGAHWKRR